MELCTYSNTYVAGDYDDVGHIQGITCYGHKEFVLYV